MYTRTLLALLSGSLMLAPTAPVSAAPTVDASTYGVVAPEDDPQGGEIARVTIACVGKSDGGISTIQPISADVTCEIWDSSGLVTQQIKRKRNWSGPNCVCVVNAFNLKMPIKYCATVEVTFSNSSKQSDRSCKEYGSPAPPETSPPPSIPGFLECMDPAGTKL